MLFNTPRTNEIFNGTFLIATFATTLIPMSTYLVAFAIGHFDYLERISDSGVLFRIYTPRNLSSWAEFALNVSIDAVDFFGRQFQFSYSNLNSKVVKIIPLDPLI